MQWYLDIVDRARTNAMAIVQAPIRHPVFNPTLPTLDEIEDGVRDILASGQVTVGRYVAELENEVCELTGVKHAVAVSSGTSGLLLLLRALNLRSGSEVITPSFTFAATSQALLWLGLKPVFCDCESESFTMDAAAAEALITERTSAIYPVCVFGVPGDLDAYQKLADKYGLILLYDSAQGLGSTYKGKPLGNFGVGEVFSLSPTKVVTSLEGGLLTTNYDEIAECVRRMRDYGKGPDGQNMISLGLSARMTEFNALVGCWSLARIDMWLRNRAIIMARYRERLSVIPGISFQRIPDYCTSSRNYMVILLDPERSPITRDELYERLKECGIQTKRYFYPPLHNQTLFRDIDPEASARLPVTERISARSLALPMYSHMSLELVDYICDRILEFACC